MKLKAIEIQGFKSFPDKTTINFKEGITSIVGPNGSGKSNISDAVRWVLGEQSVKSLRGSKMEDVLFAGTAKRKPLNFCEVTLLLDNSTKEIPIEYDEISFTRRMFRSGESEYYINRSLSRLKDMRELLMDTGIGKDGYSIIGQGRIDEILSNKSEDRRYIFEEAAEIVKYKSKKEESEKKLIKTEENLIRIQDIVGELRRQERSLEAQAKNAREYKGLYEELKYREINLFVSDIKESQSKLKSIIEKSKIKREELSNIEREYRDLEIKLENKSIEYKNISDEIENLNEESFNIYSQRESLKNESQLLEGNVKHFQNDINRINRDIERLNLEIEENIEKNTNLNDLILKTSKEIEIKKDENKKELDKLTEINKIVDNLYEKVETGKDSLIDLYNEIATKESIISNIDNLNKNINNRLGQNRDLLLIEEKELKIKSDKIKNLKENEEKLVSENEKLNIQLKTDKKYLEELTVELNKENKRLNDLNLNIERNSSNLKVFKDMEDSYEGFYRGVREVLQNRDSAKLKGKVLGVVAEIIDVDKKYSKAVSTALGGASQNLITKNQKDGKDLIDFVTSRKSGRITVLPLDIIKGRKININKSDIDRFNIYGLASEIINYEDKFKNIIENLLGRTIVVKDLENAIGLSNKYKNTIRIVTLNGELINPGGSMVGGAIREDNRDFFTRKNKIEEIENYLIKLNSKRYSLLKILDELEESKNNLIINIDENEKLFSDKNIQLINTKSQLESLLSENERLNTTIERLKLELHNTDIEIKDNNKTSGEAKEKLEELKVKLENKKELIKTNEIELINGQENRDEINNIYTENRILIDREINNLNNLKIEYENRINSNESINITIKNLNLEKESNNEKISQDKEKILKINSEIEIKEGLSKEIEKENSLLLEKRKEIEEIQKQQQNNRRETELKLNKIRDENSNLEIKNTRLTMETENLIDKLYDNYELTLDTSEEFIDLELDLEKAKAEVKELNRDIKKLGTINLSSIEEYEELLVRMNFIEEQKEDLLKAKDDLEKVITNMESKMKIMFKETFDEINKNFIVIFKSLFNGGNAKLIIEDEEDYLNSGIEIQAQPPGKKLQNLSSLSGGERSLVAVAILFAVLETKPAPFCILDEIDAALDEANIGRYTEYLRRASKDTQFIIITHRKLTMEVADNLYGVTMEEEGVSKLLSIQLSDYEED